MVAITVSTLSLHGANERERPPRRSGKPFIRGSDPTLRMAGLTGAFGAVLAGCGGAPTASSSAAPAPVSESILIAAPLPGTYDFIRTAGSDAHTTEVVTARGRALTVTDSATPQQPATVVVSQYVFDDQRGLFLTSLTGGPLSCRTTDTLPLVMPRRAHAGLEWSGTYGPCQVSSAGASTDCLLSLSGTVAGTVRGTLAGQPVLLVDVILATRCVDRSGSLLLASTARDLVDVADGIVVRRSLTSNAGAGVLGDDVQLAGLSISRSAS